MFICTYTYTHAHTHTHTHKCILYVNSKFVILWVDRVHTYIHVYLTMYVLYVFTISTVEPHLKTTLVVRPLFSVPGSSVMYYSAHSNLKNKGHLTVEATLMGHIHLHVVSITGLYCT